MTRVRWERSFAPAPVVRFAGRLALAVLLAGVSARAQSSAAPPAPTLGVAPPARAVLGLSTDAAARLYAEGRAAALGLRLDEADAAFARLARTPGPAGAYGLEATALWRLLITETAADADRFYARNDSLGELADALPDGPEAEWLRATVALHRALALDH